MHLQKLINESLSSIEREKTKISFYEKISKPNLNISMASFENQEVWLEEICPENFDPSKIIFDIYDGVFSCSFRFDIIDGICVIGKRFNVALIDSPEIDLLDFEYKLNFSLKTEVINNIYSYIASVVKKDNLKFFNNEKIAKYIQLV